MLENNNYMFPVLSELYKAPLHFTPSCSQVLHCVHIHASTKQIWIHMISSETDLQQLHQVYLTSDGSKQLLLNNHQCMLGRLTVTWPDRAESCRRLLIWEQLCSSRLHFWTTLDSFSVQTWPKTSLFKR